jgi:hypothetical protein
MIYFSVIPLVAFYMMFICGDYVPVEDKLSVGFFFMVLLFAYISLIESVRRGRIIFLQGRGLTISANRGKFITCLVLHFIFWLVLNLVVIFGFVVNKNESERGAVRAGQKSVSGSHGARER